MSLMLPERSPRYQPLPTSSHRRRNAELVILHSPGRTPGGKDSTYSAQGEILECADMTKGRSQMLHQSTVGSNEVAILSEGQSDIDAVVNRMPESQRQLKRLLDQRRRRS